MLYQSSYQGFSCSFGYSERKSSASASFNHAENPGASTDPPAVVLAFVAKHGFVDLYSLSTAAKFNVAVQNFQGADVSESLKYRNDCTK